MKKIIVTLLSLTMLFSLAGCTTQNTDSGESSRNQETQNEETQNQDTQIADTSVNEGELQLGVYTGTVSYSQGEFSMTWNIVLDFNEDNTFVLSNETGEEKGAGTYELTDSAYTMTYNDGRACAFSVQQDGSLALTTEMPYGKAAIGLDEVGGIVLNYHGESYEFTTPETDATTGATSDASGVSIAAGSYSASGTYVVEDGKFVFTDTEGNVIEGTVTDENTFVISLKASEMASDPYEVTFAPAE